MPTSRLQAGEVTPMRQYKSIRFELDSADETTGEFVGHAAVFGNVDDGGDIIQPGAFTETIRDDFHRIKILSQHDSTDLPIGRPIELREDAKGLYIRGKISDTQKGRDVITLMKDGVLTEMSIGYDALDFDFDNGGSVRRLKKIRLWEISIVTWAMNDLATIDGVKSVVGELRAEVKAGRMTRAKLNALKPFIAIVRELADILGPFLESQESDAELQKPVKNQTKNTGMVFEIIPSKNRR